LYWGFFMPKKNIFIVVFLAGMIPCLAQKIMHKEYDASQVETLIITSNEIFTIEIHTGTTAKIMVETNVEGENYEQVILNTTNDGKVMSLGTSYAPYFEAFNDKLAAHKLIAIDMKITIPENIAVQVNAKIASVDARGSYRNLEVSLENGNFRLTDFEGNATVYTKQGDIIVYASSDVSGDGISKYGRVKNLLGDSGKYHIKAESITGDISLFQTK